MMTKVLQLEISLLLQITTNQGDIVFKKLLLFNFIFSGFFCVLFCFVLFLLHWVFVDAHGLSLVAVSEGFSLVEVIGLLTAAASLISEHGL